MKNSRLYFNLFVYISLLFLVWFLVKQNYFSLDFSLFRIDFLLISVVFLLLGYILSPLGWKEMLLKHQINSSYTESYKSEAMSVFSKYIPGKVLIILGRAGFISMKKDISIKITSIVSLKAQLIHLCMGLILGSVSLIFIGNQLRLFIIAVVLLLALFLFLFNSRINHVFISILNKIFRKGFDIPLLLMGETWKTAMFYSMVWLSWSIGFFFFAASVHPDFGFSSILIFPLAATLGMMAVIIPGGLGVREGILAFLIHQCGVPIEIATTISFASRLWFLLGEVIYFVTGLMIRK